MNERGWTPPAVRVMLALVLLPAGALLTADGMGAVPADSRIPLALLRAGIAAAIVVALLAAGVGSLASSGSTTWFLGSLAALAIVAAGVGVVLVQTGVLPAGVMSGRVVADGIAAEVSGRVDHRVVVACPRTIPRQKGHITDCTGVGPTGASTLIRVKQDDAAGHYHYEIAQAAALTTPNGGA